MRSKLIFVRWSDTRLSCIKFHNNHQYLFLEVTWISIHSSRFRNEFHILEIDKIKFLVIETWKVLKSSHLQGQTTDALPVNQGKAHTENEILLTSQTHWYAAYSVGNLIELYLIIIGTNLFWPSSCTNLQTVVLRWSVKILLWTVDNGHIVVG